MADSTSKKEKNKKKALKKIEKLNKRESQYKSPHIKGRQSRTKATNLKTNKAKRMATKPTKRATNQDGSQDRALKRTVLKLITSTPKVK